MIISEILVNILCYIIIAKGHTVYKDFTTDEIYKNICTEGGRYYADPYDCHYFVQCSNGNPYKQKCAAPLYWNQMRLTCQWSGYHCSGQIAKTTEATESVVITISTATEKLPGTKTASTITKCTTSKNTTTTFSATTTSSMDEATTTKESKAQTFSTTSKISTPSSAALTSSGERTNTSTAIIESSSHTSAYTESGSSIDATIESSTKDPPTSERSTLSVISPESTFSTDNDSYTTKISSKETTTGSHECEEGKIVPTINCEYYSQCIEGKSKIIRCPEDTSWNEQIVACSLGNGRCLETTTNTGTSVAARTNEINLSTGNTTNITDTENSTEGTTNNKSISESEFTTSTEGNTGNDSSTTDTTLQEFSTAESTSEGLTEKGIIIGETTVKRTTELTFSGATESVNKSTESNSTIASTTPNGTTETVTGKTTSKRNIEVTTDNSSPKSDSTLATISNSISTENKDTSETSFFTSVKTTDSNISTDKATTLGGFTEFTTIANGGIDSGTTTGSSFSIAITFSKGSTESTIISKESITEQITSSRSTESVNKYTESNSTIASTTPNGTSETVASTEGRTISNSSAERGVTTDPSPTEEFSTIDAGSSNGSTESPNTSNEITSDSTTAETTRSTITAESNICHNNNTEYHAEPSNCTKFIECVNGQQYILSCPELYYWDAIKESCAKGECLQITTLVDGTFTTEGITSNGYKESPEPEFTTTLKLDICISNNREYHLVPYDCSKFIECVDGQAYELECPQFYYWDNQQEFCALGDCRRNLTLEN